MRSPRAAVGTNTKEKMAQRGTSNGSRTKMTTNVNCKACAAAGATRVARMSRFRVAGIEMSRSLMSALRAAPADCAETQTKHERGKNRRTISKPTISRKSATRARR